MGGAGSGGSSASGGGIGLGGRSGEGGSVASGGSKSGVGGAATGGAEPGLGGRGGAGGTVTGTGGSTHTGKWRIMLLGDSITETTCYPKLLSQDLVSKGHTNFEFVGTSLNNQSCGTAPNVQTEGHGCYLVTNLVKDVATVVGCGGTKGSLAELKSWAAEKPEVVLMEYGTNDAWSSIATQSILDAYTLVIDQFRAQNPGVIFFVAQITPLNPSGCSDCEANVEALNAKIPAWASGKSTAASPIRVVNVWSALPAATYTPNSSYTSDGCHPNPAGSQLMADKWYEGITAQGIP
jgi:lysophospholipase L1-like esterase